MKNHASPYLTVEHALERLKKREMLILIDDEDRENEGDLLFPAENIEAHHIAFMAKKASGLICVALSSERVDALKLPQMVPQNEAPQQTAFTVSVEARDGVSSGISAQDRAHTIQSLLDPKAHASDFISPGHIFPLRARPYGVFARRGHTEASVDLVSLAGFRPGAVICEIIGDSGEPLRGTALEAFAHTHGLGILSIQSLTRYRAHNVPCLLLKKDSLENHLQVRTFHNPVQPCDYTLYSHPAPLSTEPPQVGFQETLDTRLLKTPNTHLILRSQESDSWDAGAIAQILLHTLHISSPVHLLTPLPKALQELSYFASFFPPSPRR